MTPLGITAVFIVLDAITVILHEATHYTVASLLGYKLATFTGWRGIGFYIEDSQVRSVRDAVIINLSPQIITVILFLVGYTIGGVYGLLLLMVGLVNVLSSTMDVIEVARFYQFKKGRNPWIML